MGLAIPRPAIRKGEARKVSSQLSDHASRMDIYIANGKSREEASRLALQDMMAELKQAQGN